MDLAIYSDDGRPVAAAGQRVPPPLDAGQVARQHREATALRHGHHDASSAGGPGRYVRLSLRRTVAVDLTARDGGAVVTVRDQGIGIPPEDQPRVFTPFFRGDLSRGRDTGGVGVGLALSKRIVEAHGGRITLESAPGKGTAGTVWLPAAPHGAE